jgi:hypothetical protein
MVSSPRTSTWAFKVVAPGDVSDDDGAVAFLPLLALPAFFLIGLGVYRPYKYGIGSARHIGLVPLGLFLFGYVVSPLLMGLARGFPRSSAGAAVPDGPPTMEIVAIVAPVLLAMVAGAINVRRFPPRTR